MLPFGVTIPATVQQRSEIPEGLMNYPVLYHHFSNFHSFRRTENCTGEYWIIFTAMEDKESGTKVT
jgi:hypothetical protein